MKRSLRVILSIALIAAFITTSMGLATIAVKSIKLNAASVKISVGKTYKLKVTFTPANSTNKKVIFSSADKNVATVSSTGYIKGIKPGKTIVTVTSQSNKKAVAKCNITISLAGYILPLTKKGESLSIGTHENWADTSLADGNVKVMNQIEKDTGVKIDWQAVASNYGTVMQTRLAAGKDLPDIILVPGDPVKYANDGLLIPIDELIEKYAPNIKMWFEMEPNLKKLMTAPDGRIYTLGNQITAEDGMSNDRFNNLAINLRLDWLKKLGLKEPDTLDDLYKILLAFRDKDPDGNAKKDTIPWGGRGDIAGIGWAYGLRLFSDSGWTVRNGKVDFDWINPKAKDLFKTLNKWFKEGVMDKEFASRSGEQGTEQIVNNKVGAFTAWAITGISAYNGSLKKLTGDPDAGFYPILPVKGPFGDREQERASPVSSMGYFAITKNCKNPELAIKWLDYACFSEQGLRYNEFGLEGISYKMVDGKPKFLKEFLERPDGVTTEMFRLGALHYFIPCVYTTYGRTTAFTMTPGITQSVMNTVQKTLDYSVPQFPDILSTKDEADKITELMVDITTYRQENVTGFITGNISIDEFDKYVQKMKELGIDEVIKIKQAQYNRFMKK